jgi:hypothetical protein
MRMSIGGMIVLGKKTDVVGEKLPQHYPLDNKTQPLYYPTDNKP